jgi:hypothetical protein
MLFQISVLYTSNGIRYSIDQLKETTGCRGEPAAFTKNACFMRTFFLFFLLFPPRKGKQP